MSVVIVRSAISPGTDHEQAFYGITYIESEQGSLALQEVMPGLATRVTESPFYLYRTTEPAYVVLNRLIRQGYRVVTANSIAGNGHWQIWTLCTGRWLCNIAVESKWLHEKVHVLKCITIVFECNARTISKTKRRLWWLTNAQCACHGLFCSFALYPVDRYT